MIETVSVVPLEGSRASVMSAASEVDGIGVYTWTPRNRAGDGRSWVEAKFTIVGVHDSAAHAAYARGDCRRPGRKLVDCRGNGTGSDGRPACGTVRD